MVARLKLGSAAVLLAASFHVQALPAKGERAFEFGPGRTEIAASGRVTTERRLASASTAKLLPGEGILLVAAGGVHQDTDLDGLLDAGETIAYRYTLLNLGDVPLSSLVLTDLAGGVTCPQPTLAPGAFQVCTRNYAISAQNAADGAVFNALQAQGFDSGALPVQAGDLVINQNLGGDAGLKVFKSPQVISDADADQRVTLGDQMRYTFVVHNSGGEALSAVDLVEPDPTRIDSAITCDASTLGGQGFAGLGTGQLLAGDTLLCRADYTVRATDESIGSVRNRVDAEAIAAISGPVGATGTSFVVAVAPLVPVIGVSKTVLSVTGRNPYVVTYQLRVRNYGEVNLTQVQVEEDLRLTFPLPVGFSVQSVAVTGSAVANPGFDGEADLGLLDPALSTLALDGEIGIELAVEVSPGNDRGPFLNSVIATGRGPDDVVVSDVSVSEILPDPDGNGIPDEATPTPVVFPSGLPPAVPVPRTIPTGSVPMLTVLALLLGLVGWRAASRR